MLVRILEYGQSAAAARGAYLTSTGSKARAKTKKNMQITITPYLLSRQKVLKISARPLFSKTRRNPVRSIPVPKFFGTVITSAQHVSILYCTGNSSIKISSHDASSQLQVRLRNSQQEGRKERKTLERQIPT